MSISNFKFAATFASAMIFFALVASSTPANAGVCKADKKSVISAIVAKTGLKESEFSVCAISNTRKSHDGYVETTVQYAEGGESFCTRSPAETRVTVKGYCN